MAKILAYNNDELNSTFLVAEGKRLKRAAFINEEQVKLINKTLPALQTTSNPFVRFGVILLGLFLFAACCSAIGVVLLIGGDHLAITSFVITLFAFISIEYGLIRRMKLFAHGVDDAFIFCLQLSALLCLGFMMDNWDLKSGMFLFSVFLGIFCCLRYADSLSLLIALCSLTGFVLDLSLGTAVQPLLPFIMMSLAGIIFWTLSYIKKKHSVKIYYYRSMKCASLFCAVLFYLAGNYFVVRKASEEMMDLYLPPGQDILLAFIFYFLTFATPIFFIIRSLKIKSRVLLWTSLLMIVFSVFSIRYFYHLMPVEISTIIGGIIIFCAAFFFMKRLKGKTTGITFEEDKTGLDDESLNLEALFVIQQVTAPIQTTQHNSNIEFGGGEFGGAGSSSQY